MRNSQWLAVVVVLVVAASAGFAQSGFKVNVSTGYSLTAFEEDPYSQDAAGTLPLGLSVGKQVTPALEAGVELLYPLGGYTWEIEYTGIPGFVDSYKANSTINQVLYGVYGRYLFNSSFRWNPFVKAGVGLYTGGGTVEVDDESEDFDIKSAVGFNMGGGVYVKDNVWVQFQYHIVSRKPDEEDADKSGANTWDVMAGYVFEL